MEEKSSALNPALWTCRLGVARCCPTFSNGWKQEGPQSSLPNHAVSTDRPRRPGAVSPAESSLIWGQRHSWLGSGCASEIPFQEAMIDQVSSRYSLDPGVLSILYTSIYRGRASRESSSPFRRHGVPCPSRAPRYSLGQRP